MQTYIVLASFTDQGTRSIKDTVKLADAAREAAGRFGVKMKDTYRTQGQYDLMTLCEGQDESRPSASRSPRPAISASSP